MSARGVCLVWVAGCLLAAGCGGDGKKPGGGSGPDAAGDGAGGSAEGGAGAKPGGGTNAGGSGNRGGTDGGGIDAGGAGATAAEAGAAGEGNNAGAGGEAEPGVVTLSVSVGEDLRPISPLIYGANQPGLDCDEARARFTLCRHRSNSWSTYNWETNASNAGDAVCNENNASLSASNSPGAAVLDRIDEAEAAQAASLVTVPMLGYVAADKDGFEDPDNCAADISKSDDYLTTRLHGSRARKGSALSLTPDTTDAWVNQDEMVAFLKNQRGDANVLFTLDRHTEVWNGDHPKLRSEALSYDEHLELSGSYAEAIKENWPGAPVLGLVGYGILSPYNFQQSPDYATKGEYLGYFLRGMKDRSDDVGVRLIDYVDMHWFPELYPDGVRVIEDTATPTAIAARVQAPRSFWDPTFKEDSWIVRDLLQGPVELFGWLEREIDENYPGTQIAMSEWAFGGGNHVSGAIAAADALGIFGQRGVGLAGVVSFGDDPSYLIGAFQAYRNYDGEGSTFGDTSVDAESSDVSRVSIYASIDSADNARMVLVAVNRSADDTVATLGIEHETEYASVRPYCITDGEPEPVPRAAVESTGPNAFSLELPAYSVCVLVPAE